MGYSYKDWRPYALAGVIILTLAGGLYAAKRFADRGERWAGAPLQARRVLVLPFREEQTVTAMLAAALSDSLAATLTRTYNLEARVGRATEQGADYVLEGEVRNDNERTAIVLRLRPAGQRAASWTATFWRSNLADPDLPADLAAAVANALRSPLKSIGKTKTGGIP